MKQQQFLPTPHCPNSRVTHCAVGACYTDIHAALEQLGIYVLKIPQNPKISRAVRYHADLQIGIIKGDRIAVGKGETALKLRLEALDFHVDESEHELCSDYPWEALLDFVSIDNQVIGNTQIIGIEYSLKKSQMIHVNQGYAKCNMALLNNHAFITSDPSIANTCRIHGFDVLQIKPGYIELPGYSTGFIGGCCGLISPKQLAVCGELQTHPDYNAIQDFLDKYQIETIELCSGNLKDIGGIIPLKQTL